MNRRIRLLCATVFLAASPSFVAACGGGSDDESSVDADNNAAVGESDSEEQTSSTDSASTTEEPAPTVPELIGDSESEARSLLDDLGVDESDIQIEERESFEAPGTVIETVPSSGGLLSGSINLIVAIAIGEVPDFVGKPISEVDAWADERDIVVTQESLPDDTKAEGEVVSTTPAAGIKATSEISVVVATLPVLSPLAELEPVEQSECYDPGFETGEASLNGESIQDSVVLYYDCTLEYDFGRDWSSLKSTIGVSDRSDSDTEIRLKISLDSKEVYNKVLTFGSSEELELDVSGVLRVRFETISIDKNSGNSVVLGNLRRIGAPGSVPEEPDPLDEEE